MGAFAAINDKVTPPAAVIDVPTTAFADEWEGRPEFPVRMGLRLISEGDVQAGRAAAVKRANLLHPDIATNAASREAWIEAHNDALLAWIVARGTCADDNTKLPFDLWEAAPEDIVPQALTSEGLRFIFDAWERMKVTTSPIIPEASDAEVERLCELIAVGLPTLNRDKEANVRRLIRHVLDEITDVGG